LWHSGISIGHAEQQAGCNRKKRNLLKSMTINWLSGQAQFVPAMPHQTAKWPHQPIRKETINQPQWHHHQPHKQNSGDKRKRENSQSTSFLHVHSGGNSGT